MKTCISAFAIFAFAQSLRRQTRQHVEIFETLLFALLAFLCLACSGSPSLSNTIRRFPASILIDVIGSMGYMR